MAHDQYRSQILTTHAGRISAVAVTPDGVTVVAGSSAGTVTLSNTSTGETRQLVDGPAGVTCLAITPNGETVIVGTSTATAQLWNVLTGQVRRIEVGDGDHVVN